ncbi:hypothetical protein POSPLADRAFT_1032777 [Postia placenta MAD-698-R-SB12]|uniref:Uncharacterized protein n=1 Tax=Postia placenta MAD-698-R-SB12 TaxID=670580 RepID=A0A1X6N748_9APHY|nr:hypothetical protein POSPLADRAFT_1032777 [Postia placenta MAD-698-R-SB12]OSX64414.1 hypothetical protein POSPLADRAFT_1032777 [Postia placenta MAD-698-R-SB12]
MFDDPPPPYAITTNEPHLAPGILQTQGSTVPRSLNSTAHLRLLGAFKALRSTVEENLGAQLPDTVAGLDAAQRWAWFVGLAVDRFERWAAFVSSKALKSWVKTDFPPLDVLMVWHAYMLNPRWYAEDCERLPLLASLKGLGDRLLPAVPWILVKIEIGDPTTYHPSGPRETSWAARTGMPWDPFEASREMIHRRMKCPKCHKEVETPYLTPEGTGYAQRKFAVACSSCRLLITKEGLGLAKFADDLVSDHKTPHVGFGVYFAGTLHTEMKTTDELRANRIKNAFVRANALSSRTQITRAQWRQEILEKFNYSIAALPAAVSLLLLDGGGRRIVNRILSAYTDDRPFSIDLVGAVIRQGSFIDKMYSFGWTQADFFDGPQDEAVLVHAITRYHA